MTQNKLSHQGQDPRNALIFFVGKDANFSSNLRDKRNYKQYEDDFEEWLNNKVKEAKGGSHKYFHHPFLYDESTKSAGRKYHSAVHKVFESAIEKALNSKLSSKPPSKLETWHQLAKATCFLDMFGEATQAKAGNKSVEKKILAPSNEKHLRSLERWLNHSPNSIAFVCFGACSLMLKKSQIFRETLKRIDELWTKGPSRVFPITHLSQGFSRWERKRIAEVLAEHEGWQAELRWNPQPG